MGICGLTQREKEIKINCCIRRIRLPSFFSIRWVHVCVPVVKYFFHFYWNLEELVRDLRLYRFYYYVIRGSDAQSVGPRPSSSAFRRSLWIWLKNSNERSYQHRHTWRRHVCECIFEEIINRLLYQLQRSNTERWSRQMSGFVLPSPNGKVLW